MSTHTSVLKSAWDTVCDRDPDGNQVSEALALLARSRHNLGHLDEPHAAALVRVLAGASQRAAGRQSVDAAMHSLQLLSRWAAQLRSRAPAPVAGDAAVAGHLLSQAASHACDLLAARRERAGENTAAGLVGSAVLFLGHASQGLAQEERTQSLHHVTSYLRDATPGLVASAAFPDIAGGAGQLLAASQAEPRESESLLSAMLTCCGSAAAGPGAQPDLVALMPLHDMMRTARRALLPAPHPGEPPAPATVWAAVIEHSMHSVLPLEQAAAALCCGGFLEGATSRGSSDAPDQQLANALSQACTEAAVAAKGVAYGERPPGCCLRRDALGISSWKAQQACGLPQPSAATWLCQLHALLEGCLRLDGLFGAASAGQPAAHATAWLHRQICGAPLQLAGPIGRTVAAQYGRMGAAQQQHMQAAVQQAAAALHAAYSQFSTHTVLAWFQELDQSAVRQMLDKLFMTYLLLVSAVWEAASERGAQSGQEAAVLVLDVLAYLHFCRMRLSSYGTLIQVTLSAASESPVATSRLLACLPSWSALTAAVGLSHEPAWLADTLLVGRVQFLFNVLTPCVASAPQAAVDRATPVMLLFLQHPSTAVATAAHALFCGLVQAAPMCLCDALSRAYLLRALPAYPAAAPAASLALGLDTLARALPADSPASPHAARQVAKRAVELLQEPGQQEAALDLSRMLFQLLLVIDVAALEGALAQAELTVWKAPPERRNALCHELFKCVSGSDDYVRKHRLARWYQQLVAGLMEAPAQIAGEGL